VEISCSQIIGGFFFSLYQVIIDNGDRLNPQKSDRVTLFFRYGRSHYFSFCLQAIALLTKEPLSLRLYISGSRSTKSAIILQALSRISISFSDKLSSVTILSQGSDFSFKTPKK
jgi:hypothetical protein